MVFQELLNYLRPLSEDESNCLELLKEDQEFSLIKNLVKQKKISTEVKNFNLSVIEDYEYYVLASHDTNLIGLLDRVNTLLRKLALQELFKEFAPSAFNIIPSLMAPKVKGLDFVKQALTLQLFSSENLHLLIIGDVNTGKTDLLKSSNYLAPHSVYSKATDSSLAYDLSATSIQPGLLPRADKGLCIIDDLSLMRKDERSNLISAMDKGFVTINKPAIQEKFDSRIRLLGASNPIGSNFSRTIENMKKQMPFDLALLQKFHLTFLVKHSDIIRTTHTSQKTEETPLARQEDLDFVKEYIRYSETTIPEVTLDVNFEKQAVDFIESLRKREYRYLYGITPQYKDTLIKLSKASARCELRTQIEQKDFDRAKMLLELSLQV